MVDENPEKNTHNKKRRSPNEIREAEYKKRTRHILMRAQANECNEEPRDIFPDHRILRHQ